MRVSDFLASVLVGVRFVVYFLSGACIGTGIRTGHNVYFLYSFIGVSLCIVTRLLVQPGKRSDDDR